MWHDISRVFFILSPQRTSLLPMGRYGTERSRTPSRSSRRCPSGYQRSRSVNITHNASAYSHILQRVYTMVWHKDILYSTLPFWFSAYKLNLPMLRLLSSKAHGRKDFWKPSEPCHVGIHWIALAGHSQMSTHLPGFQSFFSFFASFCNGQISHQQDKG